MIDNSKLELLVIYSLLMAHFNPLQDIEDNEDTNYQEELPEININLLLSWPNESGLLEVRSEAKSNEESENGSCWSDSAGSLTEDQGGSKENTESVKCGLCLQKLSDMVEPKQLPCSHTFCLPCLQKNPN